MTIDAISTSGIQQMLAALGTSTSSNTGTTDTSALGVDGTDSDFADALSAATNPQTSTLFADALAADGSDGSSGSSDDGFVSSGIDTDGTSSSSELTALLAAVVSDLEASTGAGSTSGLSSAATSGLSSTSGVSTLSSLTSAGETTTGSGPTGSDVVAEAEQFEGTPYVWGGTSPSGFDCSGLVQYVYGQLGVSLPRTSEEQAQAGTAVSSLADAQPGDLVFFAGSDGTASAPGHVGIYVGNGQMIDAPYTGTSVQVQTVPANEVVAIRRVLPDAAPSSTEGTTLTSSTSSTAGGTTTIGNVPVPSQYVGTIEQAASANGIPASLLSALLYHESRFEPGAVSSAGAEGIAQFMPSTAAGMGINPLDPTQAINGAAQLLGSYTRQFGSYADALAAYDAGASAVEQYGGIPPYAETQAYVPAVLSLAGLSGTSPSGTTAASSGQVVT